uniref:Secreted protein n=1 Tax=Heterorhabditis bacteriophora TaxID=37862 RepID=A0A1I7XBJ7_HETBA
MLMTILALFLALSDSALVWERRARGKRCHFSQLGSPPFNCSSPSLFLAVPNIFFFLLIILSSDQFDFDLYDENANEDSVYDRMQSLCARFHKRTTINGLRERKAPAPLVMRLCDLLN